MSDLQAPLFVRSYDVAREILERTAHFPRQQRFVLARRAEEAALDLVENVALALQSKAGRIDRVVAADLALTRLRLAWRLARDRRHVNERGFQHVALQLGEIGRMLGGWQRKL
ncbi:MAG: four helix bundle protein [Planctomycetes bacterium]|nr:four helix bundle protein [Planctomycetota bacterium]